jgi:hypothetical protein
MPPEAASSEHRAVCFAVPEALTSVKGSGRFEAKMQTPNSIQATRMDTIMLFELRIIDRGVIVFQAVSPDRRRLALVATMRFRAKSLFLGSDHTHGVAFELHDQATRRAL